MPETNLNLRGEGCVDVNVKTDDDFFETGRLENVLIFLNED